MKPVKNLKENLQGIIFQIESAVKVSGRKKSDVSLVAVSKKQNLEKIKEIIVADNFKNSGLAGISLGENYVQEFLEKEKVIGENTQWHFIGKLQRNKVRKVVGKVDLIHSVDSLDLLKEIDRVAKNINYKQKILLQINIANESSKSGITPEDFYSFLKKVAGYSNIEINGLMTLPPKVVDEKRMREYFKQMNSLLAEMQQFFKESLFDNVPKLLSMGTSDDFTVAIEEGANIVRVGTGVFGEREL